MWLTVTWFLIILQHSNGKDEAANVVNKLKGILFQLIVPLLQSLSLNQHNHNNVVIVHWRTELYIV